MGIKKFKEDTLYQEENVRNGYDYMDFSCLFVSAK